jgi:L-lactate dehydrogenase complex protein LldE
LFSTCLVDQVLPEIGVATVRLLRRAGYQVEFPEGQTCCGQPFFNSGFQEEAKKLAKRTIEVLEEYPVVVIPSGSCTTMIRKEYPHLFADESEWLERAKSLAEKTFELTEFLAANALLEMKHSYEGESVTYHDSCHMCRSLGIKDQPRRLLKQAGYTIEEMEESDRCCGFGGLFSARMPEVSGAMTKEKLTQANQTGTSMLVSSDPGCLMHMRENNNGAEIQLKHIAEVLEKATR